MTVRAHKSPDSRQIRVSREIPRGNLRRNLYHVLAEAAGFGLMVGLGEIFLPAFVLAMGLGEINAGLIATLPLIVAACLQTASPAFVRRFGSHRRWMMFCASLQCFSLGMLVLSLLARVTSAPLTFLLVTVYWTAGLGASSAWHSWMSQMLPDSIRPRFYARRARTTQLATFTGFVLGGVLIQSGASADKSRAFTVLFSCAMLARLVSVWHLARQRECLSSFEPPQAFSRRGLEKLLEGAPKIQALLIYFLVFYFGVSLAAPFFSPYLLGRLHVSYVEYALLISATYLTKYLTFPLAGTVARHWGVRRLMRLAGAGIILLPLLWLSASHFAYLLAIHVVSGIIWAAFELSSCLLLLEVTGGQDKMRVLALNNLCQAAVVALASLVGAMVLQQTNTTNDSYRTLFYLSAGVSSAAFLFFEMRSRLTAFTATRN